MSIIVRGRPDMVMGVAGVRKQQLNVWETKKKQKKKKSEIRWVKWAAVVFFAYSVLCLSIPLWARA